MLGGTPNGKDTFSGSPEKKVENHCHAKVHF